jgi:hypothetical protein
VYEDDSRCESLTMASSSNPHLTWSTCVHGSPPVFMQYKSCSTRPALHAVQVVQYKTWSSCSTRPGLHAVQDLVFMHYKSCSTRPGLRAVQDLVFMQYKSCSSKPGLHAVHPHSTPHTDLYLVFMQYNRIVVPPYTNPLHGLHAVH